MSQEIAKWKRKEFCGTPCTFFSYVDVSTSNTINLWFSLIWFAGLWDFENRYIASEIIDKQKFDRETIGHMCCFHHFLLFFHVLIHLEHFSFCGGKNNSSSWKGSISPSVREKFSKTIFFFATFPKISVLPHKPCDSFTSLNLSIK